MSWCKITKEGELFEGPKKGMSGKKEKNGVIHEQPLYILTILKYIFKIHTTLFLQSWQEVQVLQEKNWEANKFLS